MNPVFILDLVSFLSTLMALVILLRGWKCVLELDVKLLLAGLFGFTLIYYLCLVSEWSGITSVLDPFEDIIGALIPILWAFFFYAFLQQIAGRDLMKSKEQFRKLFEQSNDSIIIHKLGLIIDVNQRACELLGYNKEQFFNLSIEDLLPEENRVEALKRIETIREKESIMFEARFVKADGTTIVDVEISSRIIDPEKGLIQGIVRNITERKRAEEEKKNIENQLQQSQKMEAIGTLAGGIAHDFNNILSIILGNTELAIDYVPEWNPARHNLEEAKTASLRAKDVVQQLLSFSRKSDQQQKPVNISPIIKECLKFLRSSIPTSIDIHRTIPDESCIVLADPTQIHQVMLNLCTNAAHAMSENGGIMEVGFSFIETGKDEAIQDSELNQGKYVKITVSDTGHGIPKEHLDKIFDPYFTTKEVGEGSGIGLSVVHGIVKSHAGTISVDSECGKGTTFNIFLPVVEKKPAYEEETDKTIPMGNERILFVDDEKPIVNIASLMLERLGYIVTTRNSSTDTLKTFRTRPDNFDLIISDMTMPEMTGDKLAKELQQIRPEIPIILCTGYSERINDEKAKSIGVRALVMKPIVKSVLAKTIRKVLD